MIHHLIIIYIRKDKVLEEGDGKRFGKDDPSRHDDTSDESKVQIHQLRDEFGLMELFSDNGIVGWAFSHCCTFLCLHAVNVGLHRRALARIPVSNSGLDIPQYPS